MTLEEAQRLAKIAEEIDDGGAIGDILPRLNEAFPDFEWKSRNVVVRPNHPDPYGVQTYDKTVVDVIELRKRACWYPTCFGTRKVECSSLAGSFWLFSRWKTKMVPCPVCAPWLSSDIPATPAP